MNSSATVASLPSVLRARHLDGTNIGRIIASPAAARIPLNSMASKPAPKGSDRNGIRSTACRTLTRYSPVQPSSSSPGSPAASGEIRGTAMRTPASRPVPAIAASAMSTLLSEMREPPPAGSWESWPAGAGRRRSRR
jgi:hypothetical protein